MNLRTASLAATAALVLAVGILLFRHALFADRLVPLIVQTLAVLLMIWARLTLGARSFHAAANPTEGGLVMRGPYRFVRHPIYSAILFFVWAGAASHPAAVHALLAGVATAATAVRIASEERLLIERYPEYGAYAAGTKRVIPFIL